MIEQNCELFPEDCPAGWDVSVISLINGLLTKNYVKRLGYVGAGEIKRHPWFQGFDWDALLAGQMKAPYLPDCKVDNFDEEHANYERTILATDISRLKEVKDKMHLNQHEFLGYEFNFREQMMRKNAI